MYVDTVTGRRVAKDGEVREYTSVLLRRSVRDGAKVGKQTLANLSALPEAAVDAVRSVLAGKTLVEADAALEVTRSLFIVPVTLTPSRTSTGPAIRPVPDPGPPGRR